MHLFFFKAVGAPAWMYEVHTEHAVNPKNVKQDNRKSLTSYRLQNDLSTLISSFQLQTKKVKIDDFSNSMSSSVFQPLH